MTDEIPKPDPVRVAVIGAGHAGMIATGPALGLPDRGGAASDGTEGEVGRMTGQSVVLLHGVAGSERMWRHVVPLLTPDYDVIALRALGHRGGRPSSPGAGVRDLVDDAERSLDELGLDRPHLVGNSLGGWMAIELARRGRAASVCALSPAGCWDVATGEHLVGAAKLRKAINLARRTRRVMPWASRVGLVRRLALRDNAVHGERVSADELVGVVNDLMACTVREELLTTEEFLAPWTHCPVPSYSPGQSSTGSCRSRPSDAALAHSYRWQPGESSPEWATSPCSTTRGWWPR